jgi:hypothetical protein
MEGYNAEREVAVRRLHRQLTGAAVTTRLAASGKNRRRTLKKLYEFARQHISPHGGQRIASRAGLALKARVVDFRPLST